MKFVIVFVALFGLALAAPSALSSNADVQIIRSDSEVLAEGYKYASETSDGSSKYEEGYLKNAGTENEAIEAQGSFSYIGDDGVPYSVSYIANENGFQPKGAHFPVAPKA